MSVIQVRVLTAEKVNPNANEDKMYRVYDLPGQPAMLQWGSQRTGRTGGQFKVADQPADAAFAKKLRDGYTKVAEYHFGIDSAKLAVQLTPKSAGSLLDGVRGSSPAGIDDNPSFSWDAPTPGFGPNAVATHQQSQATPAPVGSDSISQLTSRIQAAITLAVDNPAAAMVELADLGDELDLTKERTLKMESFFATLQTLVKDSVMGR